MFLKNYYKLLASQIFATSASVKRTNGTDDSLTVTQGYQIRIGQDNFQCPSMHQPRFLHTTAQFNSTTASNGSNNSAGAGVYFGDGDTPVTIDDYTFAGEILNTASATASVTSAIDEEGATITGEYLISNSGDSDFTVKEVGLVFAAGTYRVLLERTVLDEPVVIPAGGMGKVAYTIRLNFPTA